MSKKTNENRIREYTLTKALTNEHSGFARWGFAEKDGQEFFIKEFLAPVWPDESVPLSDALREQKIRTCEQWEDKKSAVYQSIRLAANGNIIVPVDFFRNGPRYYLVTEKVDTCSLSPEEVAALPVEKQLLILKVFAHCLHQLGAKGIVHSDLKPDNLLIKETVSGAYTVKFIDFDSGYLAENPPLPDEIQCDPTYMAPEVFLYMIEEEKNLSLSADIFSAGLIFHQYMCGALPEISGEYDYVYEAVLDGAPVPLHEEIPPRIQWIIGMMLERDPAKRLTSESLYRLLHETAVHNLQQACEFPKEEKQPAAAPAPKNYFRPSTDEEW